MSTVTAPHKTTPVDKLQHTLFELTEVQRKHNEYIKEKYKVNSLELEIIQFVVLDDRKKMKEIGEHFRVKLSTLTSTIDAIEKQKLVKRVNSKQDRRVVYLEATTKGRKLYDEYKNYLHSLANFMRKSMKNDQFDALVSGLDTMSNLTRT